MGRKRLYGETQKRRKKKQTRLLKRGKSITRVESTQETPPFKRNGELNAQDVLFLETMRHMDVQPYSRQGEAPIRREKLETLRFKAAQKNQDAFLTAMESLEVRPLSSHPSPPPELTAPGAADVTDSTCFEEDPDGHQLLADVLKEGDFDPDSKFADAPAQERAPVSAGRSSRVRRSRARQEPQAELDLHGMTLAEALPRVRQFLLSAVERKWKQVLIITGKGLHSEAKRSVLREEVCRWLEHEGAPYVRTFHWAPPRHGGEGALWVVLR